MTNLMTKKVLAELLKRSQSLAPIDVTTIGFPQQLAFINDRSRLKALHCPRRASKSFTAGIGLFNTALNYPGTKSFYVTVTRDMARNIMWNDILKVLDTKFNLHCEFNESLLEVRVPNGSTIRLIGIDTDTKQHRKLLGGKYKLVVLDEIAFFYTDVNDIIQKVIIPATSDQRGQVWMMSTSSDVTKGLFYNVTKNGPGIHLGWSVHSWSWKDNPHTATEVQETIDQLIAANPLVVNTAAFKQHYLNQWVIDDSSLVYKFNHALNTIEQPPQISNYVIGVDLGFNDATAFTVTGWNDSDKTLYVVESYKESQIDFTDTANMIKYLQNKYNTTTVVIDGANKQGIAEMCRRHDLVLNSSEKSSKWDYIRLLNADLITGNIRLVSSTNKDLINELTTLIKDPNSNIPKEHPGYDNHLTDSLLYNWRYTYSFLSTPIVPKKIKTKEQISAEEEAKTLQAILSERQDYKQWESHDDNYYDL